MSIGWEGECHRFLYRIHNHPSKPWLFSSYMSIHVCFMHRKYLRFLVSRQNMAPPLQVTTVVPSVAIVVTHVEVYPRQKVPKHSQKCPLTFSGVHLASGLYNIPAGAGQHRPFINREGSTLQTSNPGPDKWAWKPNHMVSETQPTDQSKHMA